VIEAHAFVAMFAVQILAMSALYPARFIRYWRTQAATVPPERLAQLYPGVDPEVARASFLRRYRLLNGGLAVPGLLLLGWLVTYVRRPGWDHGVVEALVVAYSMAQMLLPLGYVIWHGVRFGKVLGRPLPDGKRTASLQRRGLFDFVSPFVVIVAVLAYVLFAGFVFYVRQHPFAGFAGLVNIGGMTLVYAVNAIVVYGTLYGQKPNPFETHASRIHTMGLTVKSSIYSCIACVAFVSLHLALGLFGWQRWGPFALSVFFVITALLALMGMTAMPGARGTDGRGATGRSPASARDFSA
jgi:hypothetical protein